jgi:glycine/D-amino acid oxidase-like deaminating enzyme
MPRGADVLVVGGGIVGAACAHFLARAGLAVHVVDAGLRGATHAGMGHLVVMDDNPAELALSRLSRAWWLDRGPRMNGDLPGCAYAEPGTLWVAADDEEMQEAARKADRLRSAGVDCELIGARALAALEPALRTGLAGGLKVTGDAIVYAPNAARWFLGSSRSITVEEARVESIDEGGVRLSDGSRREARRVVLAAGLWSASLCPELPIAPKKGHLAVTDRYPGRVRHQLVELGYVKSAHETSGTSVAFNVQPRPTGQLLIGSSRQFDSADTAVEQGVLARMLARALDYAPGLADCNVIRTWGGLRPTTPDGQPLVGAHPRRANLWLAAGHEGLGVTTAPATGMLLAALMLHQAPPLDHRPYAPDRFVSEAHVG